VNENGTVMKPSLSLRRSVCLILLVTALSLPFSKSAVETKKADNIDKKISANKDRVEKRSTKPEEDLEVVQLTSRNFAKELRKGSVWLIEFYSSHCSHCIEFAPVYADIARYYHGLDEGVKVRIGKVNGVKERALFNRFHIYAFPSFYLIDGWSVYEFKQRRSKKEMMAFVEGGYKQTEPIPFYSSPMGPMGVMQGLLVTTGINLQDLFQWAQKSFGLSPVLVALIVFGSLFLGLFFFLVFLALVIPSPRQKRD